MEKQFHLKTGKDLIPGADKSLASQPIGCLRQVCLTGDAA